MSDTAQYTGDKCFTIASNDAGSEGYRKEYVRWLESLVYVPGLWRCARCSCETVSTNIHVPSGRFSANNKPQRCPNDCGPMWRVTERDAGNRLVDRLEALSATSQVGHHHKLDTDTQVFFYEQEFYVLSNFSAFEVEIWGRTPLPITFKTAEHAYHWHKFFPEHPGIALLIMAARSAHDAFKIARHYAAQVRPDWADVKVDDVMRPILRAKASQHEYVRRKLLQTGDRQLIEDSWRDDFWGWGPDKNGQNMLGKLWMEIRAELRQ